MEKLPMQWRDYRPGSTEMLMKENPSKINILKFQIIFSFQFSIKMLVFRTEILNDKQGRP